MLTIAPRGNIKLLVSLGIPKFSCGNVGQVGFNDVIEMIGLNGCTDNFVIRNFSIKLVSCFSIYNVIRARI